MSKPGLPARSDRRVAFTYNDHVVEFDDKRLVDVTQMWRAVGSQPKKEFKEWRRYVGASFIQDLAKSLRVGTAHLIRSVSKRGDKGGGTWAHWQIALAYAKYLSNDFHRFVNEAFREWVEEKADPGLKARRAVEAYENQGRNRAWIKERIDGIVERNDLTDTLKDHGVRGVGYARCTDAINKEVIGGTAKQIRWTRSAKKGDSTRDLLTRMELSALRFAEEMARERVERDNSQGNSECRETCQRSGEATREAMAKMGLA